MADTGKKYFTMQGFGTPVSAAGQGEKAGPQSSSSSDRSSTLVGNLASVEYNATRNQSSTYECDKSADEFCYVCGKFEARKNRRSLSAKLKSIYEECFGIEVENEDKKWVPHVVCSSCRIMLSRWEKSRKPEQLKFTKPMIWSKPSCREDCYFCLTEKGGHYNLNIKSKISYANVPSAEKPTTSANGTDKDQSMDIDNSLSSLSSLVEEKMQVDVSSEEKSESDSEDEYVPIGKNKKPETFNQKELNDFIRNLGLPKDGAEYAAAVLKNKNLLSKGTKAYVYRNREEEFRKFYAKDTEHSLTYCTDVKGLIQELKPNCYKDEEWRLFIDSSKRSLKAVLLHNGNTYASIPIAHSTKLKETYANLRIVLEKIKYSNKEHQWKVCGDLKISSMILGQQSGFTKFPCFLCLWDNRARDNRASHYTQKK